MNFTTKKNRFIFVDDFAFLKSEDLNVLHSNSGYVLVNDLQTPPSKRAVLFFDPNSWETFWNEWRS